MYGSAGSVRPREVPGFAEAAASGVVPARPSSPPRLLPGTSAHQALIHCGLALAGAAVLVLTALALGPESGGQASWGAVALMLGATAVGITAVVLAIGRFRRALLRELEAGYVTTTFHQGTFWFANRPGPAVGNDVVGWEWSGVWVLNSSGEVVSAPDPNADPPGFYPSPHHPGRLELWTGAQWLGVYKDQ